MTLRVWIAGAAAVTTLTGLGSVVGHAAGPPQADTAAVSTVIGSSGGTISGFGITATFAPGAVTSDHLIVLGDWPNGLDAPPPLGETAVKTFGLQQCQIDGSHCTSRFGDFSDSPTNGGSQRISGMELHDTGYQGVVFGTKSNRLVTISIDTAGTKVYIYDPNPAASPVYRQLMSSRDGARLVFTTFRPIVWTVTAPAGDTQ